MKKPAVLACALLLTPWCLAAAEDTADKKPGDSMPPAYGETIIVTASRVAESIRDAPVAVTVVGAAEIEQSPADNYGDLLRRVPGLNTIQISARDVNLTPRLATGANAKGTLVLLDGRTLYQEYFGMVLWDLLPIDFQEIKQVEVIRGPDSALWGANALSGVINIITKSPAELAGTAVRLGGGELGTKEVSVIHAGTRGKLGYKGSVAYGSQDAWQRPTALPDGTLLPPYDNKGTDQLRADLHFELDRGDDERWDFGVGFADSDGVMLTRLGPFDSESLKQGHIRAEYRHGEFQASAYVSAHDASYKGLLSPDNVDIESQSINLELRHRRIKNAKHLIVYGGSARYSHFDVTLVPAVHHRNELGGFVEDEIFISKKVRFRAGGRVDWFDTFGATLSPRTGLIWEPIDNHTFRIGFNRAYVSPSFVEEFLEFPSASVAPLPTGPFAFPFLAVGNENLDVETIDAVEVGWTGIVGGRATLTASAYLSRSQDRIFFVPVEFYTPGNPPPGWPLPPEALLDIPLPSLITYLNLGEIEDRGFEASLDLTTARGITLFANYSWQDKPDIREQGSTPFAINLPAKHRVNAGVSIRRGRFSGSLSANWTDKAFWADVPPFTAFTDSFTLVNASFGVGLTDNLSLRVNGINMTDDDVQQHIFGDILERRITTELRIKIPPR